MWPEDFEVAKVGTKIGWLNLIKDQGVRFLKQSDWCRFESTASVQKTKLSQYEDMHCNYHSETDYGVGTITSDCSKLTAKLDLHLLKDVLGIDLGKIEWTTKEGDRDDETLLDQFQSARVELGVKQGVSYGSGPLRAEAKVGATGFVEIGRQGISDLGIKLAADIKVATNIIKQQQGSVKVEDHGLGMIKDKSLSLIGAETTMSIQGGFTAGAKILGVKIGK